MTDDEKRAYAAASANRTKDVLKDMKEHGKLPDNVIIIDALDHAEGVLATTSATKTSDPVDAKNLADAKEAVAATKEFLAKKNANLELQSFLENMAKYMHSEALEAKKGASHAKGHKRANVQAELKSVRELVQMLVKDDDFRNLIKLLSKYTNALYNEDSKRKMKDLKEFSKIVKRQEEAGLISKETAARAIREKTKETAEEVKDDAKSEVGKLSDEDVRAQMHDALKKASGNKAFNDAFRMIIKLMRRVSTDKSAGGPNPYAVLAADAGIKMMHNLTGNDSFDKIIVQFKIMMDKVRRDRLAHEWFEEAFDLIEEAFEDPDYMVSDEFKRRSDALNEKASAVWKRCGISEDMDKIVEYTQVMIESIQADPTNAHFSEAINKLIADFYRVDADGKLHANTMAFDHMRKLLLPVLAERLKYVGIPKIEIHDEDMDAVFDNLAVSFYKIIPSAVEIKTDTDMAYSIRSVKTKESKGTVDVYIYDIKFAFKDVKFSIDRHKTPKIKSAGTMDIETKNNKGITFLLRYHFMMDKTTNKPRLDDGEVIIKNMPGFKIKFHKDAEHHTLLNFVTTVGGPIIKSRVKSVMAQEGTKLAELVKTQLNELFVRVNHTRVAERMSDAKTVVKDSDFNKHMKAENKEPTTSS